MLEQVLSEINEAIPDEQQEIALLGTSEQEKTSYGKFKDGETLLKAYNALEGEFTRRSQRLKELEIKLQDKADAPEDRPLYLMEDWQVKVAEFTRANPAAAEYSEDIANELIKDESLAKDNNCLNIALQRVLASKYRAPEQIVKDSEFIEKYIINNESIRTRIIDEYLSSLNSNNLPELIARKGEVSLSPPARPRSIEEAGEMAKKILIRR